MKGSPEPAARRPRALCWVTRAVTGAALAALVTASGVASAAGVSPAISDKADAGDPAVGPPDTRRAYLQYGLAFTVEDVLSAGPICSTSPCILGSGGGIAVRVGFRAGERLYLGGTYELSKQEPNKLYLLGILQQVRAEGRWYFPTDSRTTPFALAGAGVAGYGNEWNVDTWGPSAELGGGIEVQLSGGSVVGLAMVYRPIYLGAFVDSSTASHGAGVAQFMGLELAVEAQDAL